MRGTVAVVGTGHGDRRGHLGVLGRHRVPRPQGRVVRAARPLNPCITPAPPSAPNLPHDREEPHARLAWRSRTPRRHLRRRRHEHRRVLQRRRRRRRCASSTTTATRSASSCPSAPARCSTATSPTSRPGARYGLPRPRPYDPAHGPPLQPEQAAARPVRPGDRRVHRLGSSRCSPTASTTRRAQPGRQRRVRAQERRRQPVLRLGGRPARCATSGPTR